MGITLRIAAVEGGGQNRQSMGIRSQVRLQLGGRGLGIGSYQSLIHIAPFPPTLKLFFIFLFSPLRLLTKTLFFGGKQIAVRHLAPPPPNPPKRQMKVLRFFYPLQILQITVITCDGV